MNYTDQESYVTITPPREFSFAQCLAYMKRSTNECLHSVNDNAIIKAIKVEGNIVLIRVSEDETSRLRVDFLQQSPHKDTRQMIAQYVWDWFDLERDLTPFYEIAQSDTLVKDLVDHYYGLRIVGINDLFEALSWAILGQQINLAFAYTLKRRLVENFGEHVVHNNESYWVFPSPERIADLSTEDLIQLQISGKKAEYLIGVARLMKEGSLSKQKLLDLHDYLEAEKQLIKIYGIGSWTANYVLLRCLKDPSAFPIQDVGIHNAIKQQLELPQKPSIEEIKKMSANWTGWEGYVTFYLWRALV